MGTVRFCPQGLSLRKKLPLGSIWENIALGLWRVAVLTGQARPVVEMPPAPVREMLLTNLSLREHTTDQKGAASGRRWTLVVRGLGVSEDKREVRTWKEASSS